MIVTKLSGIVGGTLITALWNRAFYKKKIECLDLYLCVFYYLWISEPIERWLFAYLLLNRYPFSVFIWIHSSLSHTQNPIKTVLRPHSPFIRITWLLNGVVCVRKELLFLLSCGYVMCQNASNAVRWQCKGKQFFVPTAPLNEKKKAKKEKKTERKYDRTSNSNGK